MKVDIELLEDQRKELSKLVVDRQLPDTEILEGLLELVHSIQDEYERDYSTVTLEIVGCL
jgi:hypothetical protein